MSAVLCGDADGLRRAVGNLIDNALKYGKRAHVSLHREDGHCVLRVDDDGPGIPSDKVAGLLQRGVRGDERVQGHGIGLSIVQDLVHGYRGTLDVRKSDELGGARFEVQLPPRL